MYICICIFIKKTMQSFLDCRKATYQHSLNDVTSHYHHWWYEMNIKICDSYPDT